jgi:hypothetical protein
VSSVATEVARTAPRVFCCHRSCQNCTACLLLLRAIVRAMVQQREERVRPVYLFAGRVLASNPHPGPPATQCAADKHGPPCVTDADCTSKPNCVRCAHSGFCTEVPAMSGAGLDFI